MSDLGWAVQDWLDNVISMGIIVAIVALIVCAAWRRRPVGFWRDVGAALAIYGVYSVLRDSDPLRAGEAVRNAHSVVAFEAALHVHVEAAMGRLVGQGSLLWQAGEWYYDIAHVAVTLGICLWLYARRPERWAEARWVLLAVTCAALAIFAAFPVAPPWYIGQAGGIGSGVEIHLADQIAAFPSVHTAWAGWVAWAAWPVTKRRAGKVLLAFHLAFTAFVVLYSGNHYVIDVVGGEVLLLGCVAAVRRVPRQAHSRAPELLIFA